MKVEQRKQAEHSFTLLIQKIHLAWYKNCRGGPAATKRNQYPKALCLSNDFFSYHAFGIPTHFVNIWQKPDGFHIQKNCRRLMEWSADHTMQFDPFEVTRQEEGVQVRYRYDLHNGAMPGRYTYNREYQKKPLNELAFVLQSGDYGRAVCNGRFQHWEDCYYTMDILNVLLLSSPTVSLDCFITREPNKVYQQIALLR